MNNAQKGDMIYWVSDPQYIYIILPHPYNPLLYNIKLRHAFENYWDTINSGLVNGYIRKVDESIQKIEELL